MPKSWEKSSAARGGEVSPWELGDRDTHTHTPPGHLMPPKGLK